MMEMRANQANFSNQFGEFGTRPRNLINDRERHGLQRISLNIGGKSNSGGIRDDESLLCPTPPNKDFSGPDFNVPGEMVGPSNHTGVKFFQPINFTVNLNNI